MTRPKNMTETAKWVADANGLIRVELLKYNKAAGAKYSRLGMDYSPGFDESVEPNVFTQPFTDKGIEVLVC